METFAQKKAQHIQALKAVMFQELKGNEELNLNFFGEESTFVRFNQAKVRQNTQVSQLHVEGELHQDKKSLKFQLSLSGNLDSDRELVLEQIHSAQKICGELPEDPYFVGFENRGRSQELFTGELLSPTAAIETISSLSAGNDFVGLYSGGSLIVGNENSKGQSHFFGTENFQTDYSIYQGPKAVKSLYAAQKWKNEEFQASLMESQTKLKLMQLPECTIKRGSYRSYLSPAAVSDLINMFSWNGLSYSSYRRGQSNLQKLFDKESSFHSDFDLTEDFSLGGCPRFNSLGEVSEPKEELISKGILKNALISTRSAKEYSIASNLAEPGEGIRSPSMAGGNLKEEEILKRLDTGLYLSNLHYLNWSDRIGARVTGMTRYACFWVEKGEIKGPIKDLRFDESLYHIFGSELEAITEKRSFIPNTSTYERRQAGTALIPGILLKSFTFTL